MVSTHNLGDNWTIEEDANGDYAITYTPTDTVIERVDSTNQERILEVATQIGTLKDATSGATVYDATTETLGDGTQDGNLQSLSTEEESITAGTIRAYGGAGTYTDYKISDYADLFAAVNQAITDFTAPQIILPQGDYSVSTELSIANRGTVITSKGNPNGTGAVDITYTGTAGTVIDVSANATLEGFRLYCGDQGGTRIGINSSAAITIEDVVVAECDKAVYLQEPAYYSVIWNSYLTDSTDGLWCETNSVLVGGNTHLSGNDVNGATLTTASTSTENRSIWIQNCSIETNGSRGIYIEATDTDMWGITIRDNYIEGNGSQAVFVADSRPNLVEGLRIKDNIIRGTTTGIGDLIIRGTFGGVFAGNSCNNFDGGVVLELGTEQFDLRDGHLVNTATTTFDTSGATRCFIEGIGENAGDPTTAGQWSGNGREGVEVVDTTNNVAYVYRGGAWV